MKVNIRNANELNASEINTLDASEIELYDDELFLDMSDMMAQSGLSNTEFIEELLAAMERGRK